MAGVWTPEVAIVDNDGACRIMLGSFARGHGRTLQEAADDLVCRLLGMALSWRGGGFRIAAELGPVDLRWFEFLHELGEIAAAGGDIRERVFGASNGNLEAA